ncbi:MAG: hypothetical protein M3068_08245 [Gemmatimonadota bacterium]|nr:hypothetical protein [Gemmatimonadota bacterium]
MIDVVGAGTCATGLKGPCALEARVTLYEEAPVAAVQESVALTGEPELTVMPAGAAPGGRKRVLMSGRIGERIAVAGAGSLVGLAPRSTVGFPLTTICGVTGMTVNRVESAAPDAALASTPVRDPAAAGAAAFRQTTPLMLSATNSAAFVATQTAEIAPGGAAPDASTPTAVNVWQSDWGRGRASPPDAVRTGSLGEILIAVTWLELREGRSPSNPH